MKPYLLLPLLLLATIVAAEPIQPSAIEIVDGDTIIVRGDSRHVDYSASIRQRWALRLAAKGSGPLQHNACTSLLPAATSTSQ